jgi:phage terminase large subunit-like protein
MGLSPSCKEIERLLGGKGAFRHGGHPILRWMASVVEVKNDGLDNIRPVKPNRQQSVTRIDGIQAAVTAMDGLIRAIRTEPADTRVIIHR